MSECMLSPGSGGGKSKIEIGTFEASNDWTSKDLILPFPVKIFVGSYNNEFKRGSYYQMRILTKLCTQNDISQGDKSSGFCRIALIDDYTVRVTRLSGSGPLYYMAIG